jgi:hypothetical protein
MTNLAILPEYAPLLNKMAEKLEEFKKETNYEKVVPRPRPEPDWGVKEGLICDISFDIQNDMKITDRSPIGNQPLIFGGALSKGLNVTAFSFDGNAKISFPWKEHLTPDKGSYIIETLVRSTADGVIAAQGNGQKGMMVYVDGGCPGVMLKEHGHRMQFIDSQSSFAGEWVHIVAQIKNYHNKMALWVNGELVGEEQIWWPLRGLSQGVGGMTLGSDQSGKIDPKEISPLKFKGYMQYC